MKQFTNRAAAMAVSCALFATLAAPAYAHDAADTRTAVILPEEDGEHLLADMREFLERTTGMMAAAVDGDMQRVQVLADTMRPPLFRARSLAEGTPPPARQGGRREAGAAGRGNQTRFARMQQNLPQPFRSMMFEMRKGVAEVARDAVTVGDRLHTLRQLARVQQVCIACHQVYKLAPGRPETAPLSAIGKDLESDATADSK